MFRRIGTLIALGLLALPLSNIAIAEWQHVRNPVPGDFCSVGGRQMHIDCTGAGSPAILIEAAASADWLAWQGVQSRLSQVTRVCTYDRAGHGWSEPRSGARDAETIVHELHSLLAAADVKRPLVLVGHSAGGLYVREYTREFPEEVAGAVLVDSSSPPQLDELPGFRQSYEQGTREFSGELFRQRLRVWSGWDRLAGNCRNDPSPELQYLAGQYDAEMCRPAYVGGEDIELPYFETAAQQAARLTSFGKIPLLVISQDPNRARDGMDATEIADLPVWDREQEELKSLSPMSWRVVPHGSGHSVNHDRPDVAVAEISTLVSYLRGGPAPPFGATLSR